ncbi:MAG: RnfABCDGE type electron transport complex subunit G [Thermodesulfobacteriota bacterium]
MNQSIKMVVVLSVFAVLSGSILAGFYHSVHPRILKNQLEEEKKMIFTVLEGAKSYDTVEKTIEGAKKAPETVKIFVGRDEAGNIVGYAFVAKGPGFAGIIEMMVGLKIDKKTMFGLRVLNQKETPGLGTKILEEKFTGQFKGLSIEPKIEYVKNKKPVKPNEIQAITGATISSRAIVNAVNARVAAVLDILKDENALEGGGNGKQ